MSSKVRDEEIKASLVLYISLHPEERLWQSIRNWSKHNFILVANELDGPTEDTFYWENKK